MMKHRFLVVLLVLALAGLLLVGCGPDKEPAPVESEIESVEDVDESKVEEELEKEIEQVEKEDEEVVEDEAELDQDTQEKSATKEPEEVQEVEALDVAPLESLESYRQRMTMRMDEGAGESTWEALIEFVKDPPAERIVVHATEESGESFSTEMIQIGQTSYIRMDQPGDDEGEQWMTFTDEEADLPEADFDALELASASTFMDSENCDVKGKESVEGHRATLVVCNEDLVEHEFGAGLMVDDGEITEGSVKAWISEELQVPIRVTVEWKGVNADGDDIYFYMDNVTTAINEDITIEPPAAAESSGLPEDIPLPEGGIVASSMPGMISFEVDATMDEVSTFYQEAMPELGWTLPEGGMPMPGMLTFSKDDREVMIMLSEEGGIVSGMIMVDQG